MSDTALRTADSGYLTRRMVDVCQDVIIREDDCGVQKGILVSEISENGQVIEKFSERIRGRFPVHDITDPKTGEVLISKDHMMTESDAALLESFDIHSAEIRTVLTCKAHSGICAKCYGMNLATQQPVGPGEAVGIIAAQSIGEPGTQLTMRTFHTGGVAGGDITQGLPRVEELFEARRPKKMATLAEIGGRVRFEEATKGSLLNIIVTADDGDNRIYSVPHTGLRVNDGDVIAKGTQLQDGALSPHDILRIRGTSAVHDYLIQEVLKVYRQQGVDINDKHIEVIVRQMMRKVRVEEAGDSDLLSGSTIEITEFRDAEEAVLAAQLAREAFGTNFIKLEIHPDPKYLLPDPVETLKATEQLAKMGFVVLPYIQADPVLCKRLEEAGAATVMPLAAPIGTNKGLVTRDLLAIIIEQSNVPVIVDAGLGAPSHAAAAMEMGADAVLVNTAIAVAGDPVRMARAFAQAVVAGREAYEAGLGAQAQCAEASSPLTAFLA